MVTRGQSQGIQDHLRELHRRIEQLAKTDTQSQAPSLVGHSHQSSLSGVEQAQPTEVGQDYPGTLKIDQGGTRYVNPTHWQSILDEIAEVKEYLDLTEGTSPEDEADESLAAPDISGPVLLFGNTIPTDKASLLAALPVRSVADRLVSVFLNSKESILVIIHVPTFAKEYSKFWKKPEEASISWLAFLFSILCAGSGLQLFSTSGRADGDFAEAFDENHRLASHCLNLANYTSPGQYKMEALVISVAMEILRSSDTHVGPSILLGLATRLAMHGGYHRDPKHYRDISVFDGEMRRRIWMCLSLLDHYISLQAGLPPSTIQAQSDTEEPRNLTDEDLDPSMMALPQARPLAETTQILFPVTLNRIMFANAEIMSKVCSVKGVPYTEVLLLDANLKQLHANVPPSLRCRSLGESIADSPNMIMDRYNIDLMYHKARCDLHRRYLTQHRLDPAYVYSRRECLDAARNVLQHQSDIFDASFSGGQLGYSSFFFSPVVAVHFRTAAMIVSLEISCQSRYDLNQNLSSNDRKSILEERAQLSQEIQRAYTIWNHLCHQSKEALNTTKALHVMLKITNNHLQHGATPEKNQSNPSGIVGLHDPTLHMPSAPSPPNSGEIVGNQLTPLDVDLMDASFYLGQDALSYSADTQFTGSVNPVDFYDKYWDNIMLLGDSQSFSDMTLDGGFLGKADGGPS
ncbi:uncharacterized protein TRUGW13939_00992 [Talaromyces rugulosus]|uniref:Xylanolytic transcriptional activator regulatory domain-containing protein n=1 Tax=Talaromyces rugulosus TaxID=121627 RepID=A0A7H8QJT9_TALRU|nr:uncharacterized protein TRUGW13939_00992 [Talaromyces rugulosus]QKX53912.1 hypothetical protein TRUGW13939_00992 [Talaromyces rugulosus]